MKRRAIQVGDGGLAQIPKPKRKVKLPRIRVPQVNIKITKKQIRAKTRKLKMRWSQEAFDFSGVDLEAVLMGKAKK
jgi:hypothetical protein